jgi:predicted MFS family arabinose efflux permease
LNKKYTMAILLLVYIISFLDRQIISILAQDIKEDLILSDTELGLLTGFAFALFYAVLGIPVARLAERCNRVPIISFCVLVWSAMTAAGAATGTFLQLALTRAGVGIGEAGSVAPAQSIISDMYPPEKRARPMAIFMLGAPIGILFGFLIGGVMAANIGWRQTLFWVGISGIGVALLVQFTIRDPRSLHNINPVEQSNTRFLANIACLFSVPSFPWICFGTMLATSANYAVVGFLPTYIIRTFDVPLGTVGIYLSLIIGLGGGLGLYFGGVFGDRLAEKGFHYSLRISIASMLLFAPSMYLALLLGDRNTIFLFLWLPFLVSQAWLGPAFAIIQTVAPEGSKATGAAVVLLFNNLLGLGVGPLLIGLMSDHFAAQGHETPLAMALSIAPVMALLSAILYWVGLHIIKRSVAGDPKQPHYSSHVVSRSV